MSVKYNPANDIPDLSGRVFLVTGGNAGLGKEAIAQLVQHKPRHVYLAARTASKAEEAIREIKESNPDAPVTHLPLDLTSFDSIHQAAETFKSSSDRLDVLMNNAGIMATPYSTTKEGYEIQFGTNHMGHALLTKLLLPTLQKTAALPDSDVRIVNLSSSGHQMAPSGIITDADALEQKSTWTRYGNSKLANVLFARELSRRYPAITSVSLHPGVIATELMGPAMKSSVLVRWANQLIGKLVMQDVHQGAMNQLWAATAPRERLENGGYYTPVGKLGKQRWAAREGEMGGKLWEYTEAELKRHGY